MVNSKVFNVFTWIICLVLLLIWPGCRQTEPKDLPNILWIVSEDNGPFLGCYGDELAVTPNLDQLATDGFLYTHAYANAPVCAPARNTIITGVYACSNGNQHMRSRYPLSETVKMFPTYLRELGYYCTNNAKEDYNTVKPGKIWDESSKKAHYNNRKEGQPFFHIQNINTSHESSIHKSTPEELLDHDPNLMSLPPYHPDTKEMRHDWAQYYDKITKMDSQVGEVLQKLEDDGLAESTIVFYYSDHGGVLGRSKRYVYESGTHVPFLIRIPKKYNYLFPAKNPGDKVTRLISFVDLAPTMLSICGIPLPEYLQGKAFLGNQKTQDPEYAYMFRGRMDEWYDMSRAVRNSKYRYIKNYMPHRIYGQRVAYLWRAPSMVSWEKAYLAGTCNKVQQIFWNRKPPEELYDTENDPWEVNNLATTPQHQAVLERMRNANLTWMEQIKDAGFIPESDLIKRVKTQNTYDYMRSREFDLNEVIQVATMASEGKETNIPVLKNNLKHKEGAIRYWAATGFLILGHHAMQVKEELIELLNDEFHTVVTVAAELLHQLGEQDLAIKALLGILQYPEDKARCFALNALVYLNDDRPEIKSKMVQMYPEKEYNYSHRIVSYLLEKWDLEVPDLLNN